MIELQKNEKKTLYCLGELQGAAAVSKIVEATGLAHAAVMRAALRLTKDKYIEIIEEKRTAATLTAEGKSYARVGLPERQLIRSLMKLGGKAQVDKVIESSQLANQLVPIALGWLREKAWAKLEPVRSLEASKEPQKGKDEELLELLRKKTVVVAEEMSKKDRLALNTLRKRKLIRFEERTYRELILTPKGRNILRKGIKVVEGISQITPELIVSGKWQHTKLRKFNVTAPGPPSYPGKMHPLRQIIERARRIFLEMGFTEIRGPLVETAFWSFDALFQPQDHPAREMMDTFYLLDPKVGKLPQRRIVSAVAETHENGWTTGSKGWMYKWDAEEAKKLVLRPHTTPETIKYLSNHRKPPVKVFSVDRVYRNEHLTYKHTAEFFQIEGIVMDENVTLRDLMGTLKAFYDRFGLKKVQFWPNYFPYTEPSAQAMVYVPKLKSWIELCGMGIFRPEVTAPMGIKHPVLAWGGGLERIAMLELGLKDIRLLYGNHIDWIRRRPLCP